MGAVSVPLNPNWIHMNPIATAPATPKPITSTTSVSDGLLGVTINGSAYDQVVKITVTITIATDTTFDWATVGGSGGDSDTGVTITGSAQDIQDGIQVTFDSTSGYTPGDELIFVVMPTNTRYWDGSASPIVEKAKWSNGDTTTISGGGGGVTSLAVGSSGTSPNVSSSTGAVTLNIPIAEIGIDAGLVTDASQSFQGSKTFVNNVILGQNLLSDGGGFLLARASGVVYEKGTGLVVDVGIASLDCSTANIFTVTPDQDFEIDAVNVQPSAFQDVRLIVYTSGTTSYTITFGTNIKATGTLATGTADGKRFQLIFTADGTDLIEASRTTAI